MLYINSLNGFTAKKTGKSLLRKGVFPVVILKENDQFYCIKNNHCVLY